MKKLELTCNKVTVKYQDPILDQLGMPDSSLCTVTIFTPHQSVPRQSVLRLLIPGRHLQAAGSDVWQKPRVRLSVRRRRTARKARRNLSPSTPVDPSSQASRSCASPWCTPVLDLVTTFNLKALIHSKLSHTGLSQSPFRRGLPRVWLL
jgi:hypothetical protein